MKDRLQILMKEANVSSNKLAELIGVQPSSISHILSGRNNPSYDFINKLITNFPQVDVRWLLTGKGSSGLDAHVARSWDSVSSEIGRMEPESTPSPKNIEQIAKPAQTSIFFDDSTEGLEYRTDGRLKKTGYSGDNRECRIESNDLDSRPKTASHVEHRISTDNSSYSHGEKKRIDRIIIFYADGSFSEYSNNA